VRFKNYLTSARIHWNAGKGATELASRNVGVGDHLSVSLLYVRWTVFSIFGTDKI